MADNSPVTSNGAFLQRNNYYIASRLISRAANACRGRSAGVPVPVGPPRGDVDDSVSYRTPDAFPSSRFHRFPFVDEFSFQLDNSYFIFRRSYRRFSARFHIILVTFKRVKIKDDESTFETV
ncbi:hypothetical protein EVAR_84117_1 [Eumeta japonica]|uniref:Uncharacterized protein n=1 Tax=Eumeta variegata TaxID=151549 RepID=A0A4C1UYV0_EUMVA|nr:hypothetical protein EVAR_84117_1 [Eumeta japonica]